VLIEKNNVNRRNKLTIKCRSVSHDGMSVIIPVMCFEKIKANFVLDTGACATIISTSLYNKIPSDLRPKLEAISHDVCLEVANDGYLHVDGKCTFEFKASGQLFQFQVFIAPIREDGLIGMDFLHINDYQLSARKGLRLNNKKISTIIERVPLRAVRITTNSRITIPGNTECVIPGQAINLQSIKTPLAMICPVEDEKPSSHVMIGNVLISPGTLGNGKIPVRLVNTSSRSVKLSKGSTLGYLHEIDSTDLLQDKVEFTENTDSEHLLQKDIDTSSWCTDLKDLYDRSCINLNSDQIQRLKELLHKYGDIFSKSSNDLGRTNIVKHNIEVKQGARPVKLPPRRVPRAFANCEDKIIGEQFEMGIIEESTSPWSSPLCFVRKRNNEIRVCVDYRRLNEVTKKNAHPLPRIDDCLESLGGNKYFSCLDLTSGFYQIEMNINDREKTAFVTSLGSFYQYVTMPQGLSNSPATFQHCMELIFKGLQWKSMIIYMDDLCSFGTTFDEALSRLDEVFSRLKSANLKLKPSKCHLFQQTVNILGHTVDAKGIRPTTEKVQTVKEWPVPKSLTELRSFLGFCSYYRRFIRDFSKRAAALNRLMGAGQAFNWGLEQEQSFMDLKSALSGNEVLSYPQEEGVFILDTDASNVAIGGCLSQLQWSDTAKEFVEKPISFASKSLDSTQRRYCATRRELLAVVTFVTQFRHHLLGKEFVLRTDCSSLRWIMSFKSPTDQMARWLEVLSQFDFKIMHRSGKKHSNADGLSRIPCDPRECQCYDGRTVLQELPCNGCDACVKKHNSWSDFAQFDDVVPLFSKGISQPSVKKIGVHRIGIQKTCQFTVWICLIFQLLHMCCKWVTESMDLAYCGIRKFRRNCVVYVNRLRFQHKPQACSTEPNQSHCVEKLTQNEDINSNLEGSLSNGVMQTSLFGHLKHFCTVNKTPRDMAILQAKDPDIGTVLQWISSSQNRPNRDVVAGFSPSVRNLWLHWDLLTKIDGVLFKKNITREGSEVMQLVLPRTLINEVLRSAHDSNTGGHLGIDKTYSKLKVKFYWYKMKDSVKLHIHACEKCLRRKRPFRMPKSPLTEYTVGFPLDRISTDIMGPLPESDSGNKYCLVVIDNFTKFAEAYAIPDQTASTVATKIVYEFLSRYGICLDLHSDLGSNYQSHLFKEVCRLLEINQTKTSGYRGMANGMAEKYNQVLQNMITTYINAGQTNWDDNINLVTSAYRSCVHEATGFTPNMMMFGREVTLPVELSMGCVPSKNYTTSTTSYVMELQEKLGDVYALARSSLKKNAKRQKRDYDTRISMHSYEVGDLVLCLNKRKMKGKSKKIDPNIWEGPFQIHRKVSDLLYEIRFGKRSLTKIIHHDRLKLYAGSTVPDWCVQSKNADPGQQRCLPIPNIVKGQLNKQAYRQAEGDRIHAKKINSSCKQKQFNRSTFTPRHSLRHRKPVDRYQGH